MPSQLHDEFGGSHRSFTDDRGVRCISPGSRWRGTHDFDKDWRCIFCSWLQPECKDGTHDHKQENLGRGPYCRRCHLRVQANKSIFGIIGNQRGFYRPRLGHKKVPYEG